MYCLSVAFCRAFLLGLLLIAAGLCFHSNSRLAAAAEEQRVLRAGAYAADITPTYFPVSTTPHRDHQVSEVHDRLYARCVVLDDGQTRIAIVICDNNMIPREFLDAAKAKAAAVTGIPSENMLVAATHTHSAVTGLAIKQASPLKPTFVIELANGYNGYLPTPEQHRLGGYETWRARSSYLEVDAATNIQSTLLSLLGEVASRSELVAADQLPSEKPPAPAPSLDGDARPDEPLRNEFSLAAAVARLDDDALTWQKEKKCFACHSNYTFLETRPLVSWKTPVHDELRAKLEELAANPRQVGFRVMEGVMAACVLAQNDALTTGKLHPVTRQALDYMWTLQREDGGFDWEKSNQPPSEVDNHFGATMAVLGVGAAPNGYADTPAAKAGLNKLRQYLMNTPPINLHQRSMLLLGSLHVDDIMTEAERKTLVADLFAVQKQDGGWNIVSLGHWKRHDGKPDDTQSSDGYGTGFSIYVLRQAGVPADDPRIQAGIAWLKAHQRASGRWFTRSQWEDRRHYLSRLGTAFAIRALVACGEH